MTTPSSSLRSGSPEISESKLINRACTSVVPKQAIALDMYIPQNWKSLVFHKGTQMKPPLVAFSEPLYAVVIPFAASVGVMFPSSSEASASMALM